jgi:hypothetical protein
VKLLEEKEKYRERRNRKKGNVMINKNKKWWTTRASIPLPHAC